MSLQQLLQHGRVWRGRDYGFYQPKDMAAGVATGYARLDNALPFRGWPRGALTEILHQHPGQGELQLLLPALARLTREQRYVVFIDAPWMPYAPALSGAGIQLPFFINIGRLNDADRLWTMEQVLRAGDCGAVLGWTRHELNTKTLRRLQLAAEAGNSCSFLFRDPHFRQQHSPAALRLQLHPRDAGIRLEIFKCRGRSAASTLVNLSLAFRHV